MKHNNFRTTSGFTLIELLIVVAIIGVLVTSVVSFSTGYQARARDAKRLQDITNIMQAIDAYQAEKMVMPGDADDSGVQLASFCNGISFDMYHDLIDNGYLTEMPTDPMATSDCTGAAINYSVSQAEDKLFFYAWDDDHIASIVNGVSIEVDDCIGINRLESQWLTTELTKKFGQLTESNRGGQANIGTGGDFNYCYEDH